MLLRYLLQIDRAEHPLFVGADTECRATEGGFPFPPIRLTNCFLIPDINKVTVIACGRSLRAGQSAGAVIAMVFVGSYHQELCTA